MHWSITLAMVAALGATTPEAPLEFESYSQAYWTASKAHRPMLVILNPTGDRDDAVKLETLKSDDKAREVLGDYVVAVIDTGTEHGQKVYELFGKPQLPRTVVIDERQDKQIFRTSDRLQLSTFTAVLEQYRHGVPQTVTAGRPVSGTTVTGGSLNYYQSSAGSCPNCRKF